MIFHEIGPYSVAVSEITIQIPGGIFINPFFVFKRYKADVLGFALRYAITSLGETNAHLEKLP